MKSFDEIIGVNEGDVKKKVQPVATDLIEAR